MGLSATYMDLEGYGELDRTERRDPGVAAGRSRAPMAVKAAARVLRTMVPGARIVRLYPVWRVSRFGQEWSLRRVRARRDQDLPRMVLAQTLLDALEQLELISGGKDAIVLTVAGKARVERELEQKIAQAAEVASEAMAAK